MSTIQESMENMQTQIDELRNRINVITGAQAKFYAKELGAEVEFTPEETSVLSEIAELPPIVDGEEWRTGLNLVDGTIVSYDDVNYLVIQSHISQNGWSPNITPSLFTAIKEDYAEWIQPQGAHDSYMKGDKVSYNEKVWQSNVDNNVWAPGIYGWEEIRG